MTSVGRYVLGIDLGTTNTLCAVWREGAEAPNIEPIDQPTTDLGDFESRSPIPSSVLIRDREVFVGENPKNLARLGSPNVIRSIKREMGTPWVWNDGRRTWTPDQISGCILKAVKQGIHLPPDSPPPERVVITVPACFGIEQRRATLRAARLAGFDPERTNLFDEPTAALLHHTHHLLGQNSWLEPKRLMVLDIGGGTLDVSCMTLHQTNGVLTADVLGRSRFNELAGDDFDLNIAGLLLDRFLQKHRLTLEQLDEETRRQLCAGLLFHAEQAKKQLCVLARTCPESQQGGLNVEFEVMQGNRLHWLGRVTMRDLSDALKPFFTRPKDAESRLAEFSFFTAIEECMASLRSANVNDPDRPPDYVFLAGGSSDLPFIKQVITKHFDEVAPECRPIVPALVDRPMEAVALGAAWYAGACAKFPGAGQIKLIQRMHEGIFLLPRNGQPLQLVDPSAQLPVEEREVPCQFQAGTSERLEIDLISGTSLNDVRMRPLERRLVELDGFITRQDPIRLWVAVDENRDCKLRCEATVGAAVVTGRMEFHNGFEWQREGEDRPSLPAVNPFPQGVSS